MEIGNEISQKIRSAIKAKLVELGAYVDDELPDYIMVMVANKKSQSHMTEDLNLFLGSNTERFTAWLHGLLQKLKNISVEQGRRLSSEGAQSETKPASASSSRVTHPTESGPKEDSYEVKEKNESQKLITHDSRHVENVTVMLPSIQPVPNETIEAPKNICDVDSQEEDELTLQPETDEFAEEEKALQPKIKDVSHQSSQKVKIKIDASQAKEAVMKALVPNTNNKNEHHAVIKPDNSKDIYEKESHGPSRKRKMPGSVVSTVINHSSDLEEEYDPHRPQYGRVASTVKIGNRRPTVPPSKQANKNLLMKAVSEAKDSIEKRRKKSGSRDDAGESSERKRYRSSAHHRLGTRHSDAREVLNSQRAAHRDRSSHSVPHGTLMKFSSDDIQEKRSISIKPSNRIAEVKVKSEFVDNASELGCAHHTRVIETKENHGEERKRNVISSKESMLGNQSVDEPEMELLIQSGAEYSDFIDEEEEIDIKTVIKSEISIEDDLLKPGSPKFVVSLDGINPDMVEKYEGYLDDDQEMKDLEEENGVDLDFEIKARNIMKVRPMQIMAENPVAVRRQNIKSDERCKFWPKCRNVDSCQYHHPKHECRLFPNCSFGNKCKFIHPPCKFDANCTRIDCPYAHTASRINTIAPQPIILQPIKMMTVASPSVRPVKSKSKPVGETRCRFFPKCTNMNCPFYHPQPCRYGIGCANKNKGCKFTHPPLPSQNQLKWTAKNKKDSTLASGLLVADEDEDSVSVNIS